MFTLGICPSLLCLEWKTSLFSLWVAHMALACKDSLLLALVNAHGLLKVYLQKQRSCYLNIFTIQGKSLLLWSQVCRSLRKLGFKLAKPQGG